jgi:hypothetical protein
LWANCASGFSHFRTDLSGDSSNSGFPSGVPADRLGHGVPIAVLEHEVGAVLGHVRTMADWNQISQPASLYLVLFRKP